jgi:hypothetical protein
MEVKNSEFNRLQYSRLILLGYDATQFGKYFCTYVLKELAAFVFHVSALKVEVTGSSEILIPILETT